MAGLFKDLDADAIQTAFREFAAKTLVFQQAHMVFTREALLHALFSIIIMQIDFKQLLRKRHRI